MAQEHKQPRRSDDVDEIDDVEPTPDPAVADRKGALDDDVDAILDEIDEVLETNAEDFVKSFIQKGGQ
ncbi:MAG: ubiquitin-like protein Pup [Nocardioides sp.]